MRPAMQWPGRQLDFPLWDAAALRTLPETHIREWAKAVGFPMDQAYATEEREGGTLALGTGVPEIAREELSVFSPAEWEKAKAELSFEVWA